jgi:hypothetical protein
VPELVSLRGNDFTGSLRDAFEGLTRLEFADFAINRFTGPLPPSIFDLPDIRILYFFDNLFTGDIPQNWANSPVLRDLYLHNNTLSGRVPSIEPGELAVFTEFRIEVNAITGTMPASVCALRGPDEDTDLVTLHSDCLDDPPEIRCDCCTQCF